jgi:hypothetical protein
MCGYWDEAMEHRISPEDLAELEPEEQRAYMRIWFYQNYEDPAERTPYESREGGYIYIWGGPYDAREELEGEFSGIVPDEVIDELVGELEHHCLEWTSAEKPEDYDQGVVDDIAGITSFHSNFQVAIGDIYELLETNVSATAEKALRRLLYVNVITAMETYLSDAFISTVVPDPKLMRRFVEINPTFRERKIKLSDVFKEMEQIEKLAKSDLRDIVWHNLKRIKPLYTGTLGVTFPEDVESLYKAIAVRHDLVHRNGKTKEGEEIEISKEAITDLIDEVEKFVGHIDAQLPKDESNDAPGLGEDGTIDLSDEF